MSSARRARIRPIAVALVGLLLLWLPACGDSSDGEGGGPQAGGEKGRVKAAVEDYYDDLGRYDAAAACRRMTPKAQRQIAAGAFSGKAGQDDGTCAKAFGEFLDEAKQNGGLERTLTARIGKVAIDGNEAVVTVRFGPQSGKVPMTKIDGAWKMGITVASP